MSRDQASEDASSHAESLLNVPIVAEVMRDEGFQLAPRAVDANWSYFSQVNTPISGFNPFLGTYFYASQSQFAQWVKVPTRSARDFNNDDRLIHEVLFMVHDYLHAWTYQAVDHVRPDLGLFERGVTSGNLEKLVFVHLLSEAVAVMGMDYWTLCVRGINEDCPIGTCAGPLTVSYRESQLPEYRRFNPSLEVQSTRFFGQLATFYCSGEFDGFRASDLKRSPQLLHWLRHELRYGSKQRRYTRDWFRHLGAIDSRDLTKTGSSAVELSGDDLALVDSIGEMLWSKIKESADPIAGREWKRWLPEAEKDDAPLDFRFTNLNAVPAGERPNGVIHGDGFEYWFSQYVGSFRYDAVSPGMRRAIQAVKAEQDTEVVAALLEDVEPVGDGSLEPRELLFLG